MKKNKRMMYLTAILLLVIASIVSAGTYIGKKDNLYSRTFSGEEFTLLGGEIDENGYLIVNEANAEEGMVASLYIPALEKSGYNMELVYFTSSEGNYIYAENKEAAEIEFETFKQSLHKDANHVFDSFFLNVDSDGTVIQIYYDGVGEIRVESLTLEQNSNIYRQNIVKALIFGVVCILIVYLYFAELKQRKVVLGLLLISFVASNLVYMHYLLAGHDMSFHLNRIEGIFVGLQDGVFPVKIQTPWLDGFGYPVGVFYGDALLYIPALLRMFGFSIQSSYQMFVFFINIVTSFVSYYSFKRLFDSENMGLAGAAIYTLSLYRLQNLYSRAAVGEYSAMIFLPVILVSMYEILADKKNKKQIPAVILFAFGLSGILHSHVLSCLIVALFILITCLVFVKRVLKPAIFVKLVSVVAITLVLSLDFLVPFLDYYTLDFRVNSESWGVNYIQDMGMFINQIFAFVLNPQGESYSPIKGIADEMTIGIGIVPLVGAIFYLYVLLSSDKIKINEKYAKLGNYSFIMFILAVVFSTCYFPWDELAQMNALFEKLICIIQFPWRFLIIAVLFSTVFICIALKELKNNLPTEQKYIPVAIMCIIIGLTAGVYCNSYMLDEERGVPFFAYDTNDLKFYTIYSGEYLPEGTEFDLLIKDKVTVSENVTYSNYVKDGSNINCYVSTREEGYIEFPLLHYKGYIAIDSATGVRQEVVSGFNNSVRVNLPTNYEGEIKVSFEEPFYWRIAEIVTLISWIIVMGYLLIRKFRSN